MVKPHDYPGDLFHHLQSFVVLARRIEADPRAAFEAAAFALGVDVSVLRRRMQTLSGWSQVPLWTGRGGQLRLTAAGHQVRQTGQQVLGQIQRLQREVQGRPDRISISCTGTITTEILPPVFEILRERWPEIEFQIRRAGSTLGQTLLRRGEVDLAVIRSGAGPAGFASKQLMPDRIWLAVPLEHPLAKTRRLTSRRMAAFPLISFGPRSATRRRVMEVLHPLGGRIQVEVEGRAAALRYVEQGLGIALLSLSPHHALSHPRIVFREVTRHFARASFWIIWNRSRPLRSSEQILVKELLKRAREQGGDLLSTAGTP